MRALGSYLSGRPDSSDIDILVCPSPAAMKAVNAYPHLAVLLEPRPLLMALLEALLEKGLLTTDVDFCTAGADEGSTK